MTQDAVIHETRSGALLIGTSGQGLWLVEADGRQHKTVVEITGKLLGEDFDLLIKYFDRMRRSRNIFFYDSLDTNNEAQAKKAFEIAESLLKVVKDKRRQEEKFMKPGAL